MTSFFFSFSFLFFFWNMHLIGWEAFPHTSRGLWQWAATLRRILSFIMFWSKGENRVEQTCRLLSHVWISSKRGALSLLNIKIASFPAMTLSHEFSTSPTTSSSPPSHTQQLFKRSTTRYIQCRYECLQICAKKKEFTEKMGGKKKHDIARSSCCMFWAFEFCRAGLRLNILPFVLPHLTRPGVDTVTWNIPLKNTFS